MILLYLRITSKSFRIIKTLIIYNHAQEGGGVYFEKDNYLNQKNFNNSMLLFNSAEIYGNNLVENPTHLTLFINSKEMIAEKSFQDNSSTCILKMKPYTIIEQGKYLQTQQLMIPSNQEINLYQLYILQGSLHLNYIKNMSLFFQNSRGELLYNLSSSTCNVSSVIIKNDGDKVTGLTTNHTLQYQSKSNNFELGTLAFSLNPYESNYNHLKIQVLCKIQYLQNEFKYIINAQTLKCQLGEFYIENGCQICIWSQGFYSVTYNAIKCSIYDKQKFQSITSNMINLYEGYWRPNYLSDYTQSCYKNPLFCLGGWEVGDNTCILGHKGALCEMCDVYNEKGDGKFFKDQQDFSCQSCSKNDTLVFLQFFHKYLKQKNSTQKKIIILVKKQKVLKSQTSTHLQQYCLSTLICIVLSFIINNIILKEYQQIQLIICFIKDIFQVQQINIQIKLRS